MDSPLFSPCFFGKSPCPTWTLPDRGFPCYRFPHAGDRASKVRCFYFFVLNAAIRMTISNSTAPTSIIPKLSDVSHIQMVAAQTILHFPSFLTLLISLSLGAGTAWYRWRGSNPHEFQSTPLIRGETRTETRPPAAVTHFNPLPSYEGRLITVNIKNGNTDFNPLPSYEGRPFPVAFNGFFQRISIHSPHTRGDSINFQRIHRIQGSLYNIIHFTRFCEFFQPVLGGKNAVYAVRSSLENHDSFTFAQPF